MVGLSTPSADVALVLKASEPRAAEFGAIFDRHHAAMCSPEPEVVEAAAAATWSETCRLLADLVSAAGGLRASFGASSALLRVLNDKSQTDDLIFRLGEMAGANSRRFGTPGKAVH